MKLFAILAVFVVLACTSVNTLPVVYDGPTYELTAIEDPVDDEISSDLPPIRNRRVTCDLLSWQSKWLSFNHTPCAAKCLMQRRKGGSCRDGICVCRN
ncbi:PREDICTED: defensin-2 [Cyphomyrmex costatus]|uniref:Defensin-2 n=1 Tax=Cyphomyrmex costatus TaxID=456900 RepID=A0A195CRB4_9HYME|nr:PREDICTED: defensin-2 [Cyphomyrmex costatus]KYN03246.1 Defensin-2 [Cyphomyrmex costatus]